MCGRNADRERGVRIRGNAQHWVIDVWIPEFIIKRHDLAPEYNVRVEVRHVDIRHLIDAFQRMARALGCVVRSSLE